MSIINSIFIIISIASAIFTAAFTYKFTIEMKCNPIATTASCVIMAIIAGGMWLPATLVMLGILLSGKKVEC